MLSWTLRGSPFWGAVALLLACFWGQPRVRAASVGSGSCCYVSSLVHSLVQAQTQQQNLDPGSWFTLEYEADDKSNRAPDLGWVIMALRETGIWVQTRIYILACYIALYSRCWGMALGSYFSPGCSLAFMWGVREIKTFGVTELWSIHGRKKLDLPLLFMCSWDSSE